jgi:hypothetical protein
MDGNITGGKKPNLDVELGRVSSLVLALHAHWIFFLATFPAGENRPSVRWLALRERKLPASVRVMVLPLCTHGVSSIKKKGQRVGLTFPAGLGKFLAPKFSKKVLGSQVFQKRYNCPKGRRKKANRKENFND